MRTSKFSAADSALGYAYQTRCALLYSLQHAREGLHFHVSLETLDDVTFEDATGEAMELLQTKHHLSSKSTLTNAAVDLWSSLRVWMEGRRSGAIDIKSKLFLLSTASCSPGTAPSKLRAEGTRDIKSAAETLRATAATSQSTENRQAYALFCELASNEQIALLEQVIVLDSSTTIVDLDVQLKKQIRWVAPDGAEEAVLERLEGWWGRRVIRQLAGEAPAIDSKEIDLYIEDLREQFHRESLPIDEDILAMELNEALQESCRDRVFVRQIGFVTENTKRIGFAIRDYFRAYEQRARWLRQDIVLGLELERYEQRLVEEWEMAYERVRDRLGNTATEEVMREAGWSLLNWAETVLLPIRPQVSEGFVCRGSLHMLSDERRVGWHPQFQERLAALLAK